MEIPAKIRVAARMDGAALAATRWNRMILNNEAPHVGAMADRLAAIEAFRQEALQPQPLAADPKKRQRRSRT